MSKSDVDDWRRSLTGEQVDDYTLEKYIGAGKISHVYLARHRALELPVAIKLTFGEIRDGWENEVKKASKLHHVVGVVRFRHHGTASIAHTNHTEMAQFTVWDYIPPGEDLRKYLKRIGTIQPTFLLAVVERVLHVLHECERAGVPRHGDLHAGNILIGDESLRRMDDSLQEREQIFVSDFGYGATGGAVAPKDDYNGLADIINLMMSHVEYDIAPPSSRQMLQEIRATFTQLLKEKAPAERQQPYDLLKLLKDIKERIQTGAKASISTSLNSIGVSSSLQKDSATVGQYQVSEMIGENWDVWRRLFVPTVPASSKILSLNMSTVVTGPRGCGKTMLFQRLSERLIVECGEITGLPSANNFVGFYVNANNFADAFSRYPERPNSQDEAKLICYANLCVLSDVLTVQAARVGTERKPASDQFLDFVQRLLVPVGSPPLMVGEDRLERYQGTLEEIKWRFVGPAPSTDFPGYQLLAQSRWLPHFAEQLKKICPWVGLRSIVIFVDDFSTPRISVSMQRVLNRLFLQRSQNFIAKVATEAWSTFAAEDSSGKVLQDGDDYELVDMGAEALFLPDADRAEFLEAVFGRRLGSDSRIPANSGSLRDVMGINPMSKTEFARQLRGSLAIDESAERDPVDGRSQVRGAARSRVLYFGSNTFCDMWSGDTRTMIQLLTSLLDQPSNARSKEGGAWLSLPVQKELQNQVFRNRGGEWLNSHTSNQPTDPEKLKLALEERIRREPGYKLSGEYGDHLRAVVQAFVAAASKLLSGPTYSIKEGSTEREVPRMAFRIEILDDLRLEPLENEIYRDLIRYGLFMRDSRGKSVRGSIVPRLYLRRLLLPISSLAMSKRDSVALTCAEFSNLLTVPDEFKAAYSAKRNQTARRDRQAEFQFVQRQQAEGADPDYDDISNIDS